MLPLLQPLLISSLFCWRDIPESFIVSRLCRHVLLLILLLLQNAQKAISFCSINKMEIDLISWRVCTNLWKESMACPLLLLKKCRNFIMNYVNLGKSIVYRLKGILLWLICYMGTISMVLFVSQQIWLNCFWESS